MSDQMNPLKEIGGIVTNVVVYAILQEAISAPSANRAIDPVVSANIIAESVNRNLSTVE